MAHTRSSVIPHVLAAGGSCAGLCLSLQAPAEAQQLTYSIEGTTQISIRPVASPTQAITPTSAPSEPASNRQGRRALRWEVEQPAAPPQRPPAIATTSTRATPTARISGSTPAQPRRDHYQPQPITESPALAQARAPRYPLWEAEIPHTGGGSNTIADKKHQHGTSATSQVAQSPNPARATQQIASDSARTNSQPPTDPTYSASSISSTYKIDEVEELVSVNRYSTPTQSGSSSTATPYRVTPRYPAWENVLSNDEENLQALLQEAEAAQQAQAKALELAEASTDDALKDDAASWIFAIGGGARIGFGEPTYAMIYGRAGYQFHEDLSLSIRPSYVFGNSDGNGVANGQGAFQMPLTLDLFPDGWLTPFAGVGLATNTDSNGRVEPMISGGFDVNFTRHLTLTMGVNYILQSSDSNSEKEAITVLTFRF